MTTRPGRVLIIDDDDDTVELLIGILCGAGDEAFGGLTGGDGLRVLELESPDVVLLDLKMPGLHGVDVLSGHANDDLVRTTLKRGALDCPPKPVNPQHLLRVTAAALSRRTWHTSRPNT